LFWLSIHPEQGKLPVGVLNQKNFFAELKRRNVYKVAVAYAIVAWLLIQIATQVFPFFEIPNWTVRLVVLLLILGFPIALFLAWAFEITPEGIKRAEEVDLSRSITHHTGRKLIWTTVVLAIIAATLFAYQFVRPKSDHTPVSSAAAVEKAIVLTAPEKSIAVLPFDNLSDDKSNAYFAEGIQDEILTRLSKIAALKVISRTSTQKYKSAPENLREIGKQLGVANVLEGSVQKISNAVHVNVQLIRAANDEHIWAESYNRKLDDVFTVEGEVASTIAEQLNAKLTGAEEKALTDKPTQIAAAYDAYLRGLSIENAGHTEELPQVAAAYAEATRIDPKFALAWAHLTVTRSRLYFNGVDMAENSAAAVKDAADRALALKPESGEAWIAQGVYRYRILRDFNGALQSYGEALKRLPNSSFLFQQIAHVERRLGRGNEAAQHYEAAAQLDPNDFDNIFTLADVFLSSRRFSEAEAALDRVLRLSSDNETALAEKSQILQNQGRLKDASDLLAKISATSQNTTVSIARNVQAFCERRFDAAIAQIRLSPATVASDPRTMILLGYCQERAGKKDEARATYQRAIATIKPSPDSVVPIDARALLSTLAFADAGFGEKEKALAEARAAVAEYETDALAKPTAEITLAQVQAYFGDLDSPISALPHLLEVHNGVCLGELRINPLWDPLRKDPRFAKLIAESNSTK
jgi:TolB-like protein/Tfp pilus assembly protein PilF